MKHLFYINLTNKTAIQDLRGGTFIFPNLVAGETVSASIRFVKNIDGVLTEVFPNIRGFKASLGFIDRRPETGQFQIQVGNGESTPGNTTDPINHNAVSTEIEDKLNALTDITNVYGQAKVYQVPGGWIVIWGNGTQEVSMKIVGNRLFPISYGRVRSQNINGKWHNEIRLIQTPLSFTSSYSRVLPPAPVIDTIQDGGIIPPSFYVNEIQRLRFPNEFRGTYQIRSGYRKTRILDETDGAEEIQEALNEMWADEEGKTVTVTNPTTGVALINFDGEGFQGVDVEELTVEVYLAPPGDVTFSLDLKRWEVYAALRDVSEITDIPLEITLDLVEPEDDPLDADITGSVYKVQIPSTLVSGVAYEELATVETNQWQRPPQPKDYTPYTPDQIIVGQKSYSQSVGTGDTTAFVIDHNLGAEAVHLSIRENKSGGRLLKDDEYDVEITSDNSLTVVLTDQTPEENGLIVSITSAGDSTALNTHTHTIQQIENLSEVLDDLGTRVQNLESYIPSTKPGEAETTGHVLVITIPEAETIMQNHAGLSVKELSPRGAYLLPAVHNDNPTLWDDAESLPTPGETAGNLFKNDTGSSITLSGGGNIRGSSVAADEYFASDGRILYPVVQYPDTNSFYPLAYEQQIFMLFIDEKQLRVGRTFEVTFGVQLQLLNATSKAQWVLEVNTGTAPQDEEPNPTGLNLQNIEWNTSPALSHRIILTPELQSHFFGIRIQRPAIGSLKCDRLYYGYWENADESAPASPNFALRARLIQFDTENSIQNARGWVYQKVIGSLDTDSEGNMKTTPAQARIF